MEQVSQFCKSIMNVTLYAHRVNNLIVSDNKFILIVNSFFSK